MNDIFDWCVRVLEQSAHFFGTTYKSINVWIFVIIEPIIFFVMLIVIIRQSKKLKRLSSKQ